MQNTDIECGVLSSILFDPSNIAEVLDQLDSRHFTYVPYQLIFEACREMHLQGNLIDSTLVKNKLGKKVNDDTFEKVLSQDPLGSSMEGYIKKLQEMAILRDLKSLATQIASETVKNPEVSGIIDLIEKRIFELSIQSAPSSFRTIKEVALLVSDRIKHQKPHNRSITGIATGFLDLDTTISGLNEGDLIILGARPGMGKTALSLNIAHNVLSQGYGVAIFSLEMSDEQLVQRMLSSASGIPLQNIRIGDLRNDEMSIISEKLSTFAKFQLFIDDGSELNIAQIRSKLRKLKGKNPNVKVAIIDYLQLMRGNNRERHLEVSEISRGLKILARELKMPIIALSQLNRGLEMRDDKRPILSDLRESGSIEQDADIILFLHSDEVYQIKSDTKKLKGAKAEENREMLKELKAQIDSQKANPISPTQVIVAKNRNGETKDIYLQFNKRFTRFEQKTYDIEEKNANLSTKFSIDEF
ncbi:MAG: replicative DNA helicase [Helicobacter sp.]|nr:replicative DNA helicase [Helicobacter sp.]